MRAAFRPFYSRRALLTLMAATAALPACAPPNAKNNRRVAVIGGGIIGTSIAYHLARAGAKVTLLERHGLAERASHGTFAWINATWSKQPRNYHALNQAGLSGWQRLQADLAIPIRWGGSLEWFPSAERQSQLAADIEEQIAWDEPAEMIGPDTYRTLEPSVDFGGVDRVAYSPRDGALDPVLASHRLADAAVQAGAVIKENCAVNGVAASGDGGVTLQTCSGDIDVDTYVLATGADPDATRLLADIEIPQRSTPGVIVITKPMPRLINRIIVAPGVHIHQRDDGCVILGEQDGVPNTVAHAERLIGRPTRFPDTAFANQHALRILTIAAQFVPALAAAVTEEVIIGWRPLPLDGHPVLGRSPNRPEAYLAIMHSGVSLAPIVGDLVAREIIHNTQADALAAYRPDRDFQAVRRY